MMYWSGLSGNLWPPRTKVMLGSAVMLVQPPSTFHRPSLGSCASAEMFCAQHSPRSHFVAN